jgi:hypothetical protein
MKSQFLIFIIISTLTVSCTKENSSYEIGISDVLHRRTFFRAENCKTERYYNIMISNDTLFVDGKIDNGFGNYTGILNDKESKILYHLIKKINPKNRKRKEINPTTGMTALIIKKNGFTLDSLVDFEINWTQSDSSLFKYIGKLICEKDIIKTLDSIIYPTWEMVKPPE